MTNAAALPDLPRALRAPAPPADEISPAAWDQFSRALYAVQQLCPDIAVLSVYWIHLQHPIHPIQEEMIRDWGVASVPGMPASGSRPSGWRVFSVCVWRAARLALKLAHVRRRLRKDIDALCRERFEVVAKTWGFEASATSASRDFYYGDFQKRLAGMGRKTLMVAGDARHLESFDFAHGHTCPADPPRIAEYALLSAWMPLGMVFGQLWASIKLRFLAGRQTDPLVRRICVEASHEVLSHQSLLNGLHYHQGRTIARLWRPKAVVTLYEGRSNERCLWLGVKSVDRRCVIVGYQHTFLFPTAASLLKPAVAPGRHTAPDVVLCLGEESRRMLEPGHRFYPSRLVTFGTFRRNPEAEAGAVPHPRRKTVLVLPQGFLWEARILFDAAMHLARRLADHRFILRPHPFMPFSWIRPSLRERVEDFPNVEVSSSKDMEIDVRRSSVALYMGSSSVLYTIFHGLKPIHHRCVDRPDADPLTDLGAWRESSAGLDEAEGILRRYAVQEERDVSLAWRSAVTYVERRVKAVDEASILGFLEAAGL